MNLNETTKQTTNRKETTMSAPTLEIQASIHREVSRLTSRSLVLDEIEKVVSAGGTIDAKAYHALVEYYTTQSK